MIENVLELTDEDVEKMKKKSKKCAEEDFESKLYNKRCQLVKLSYSSKYPDFIEFVRENEKILSKMDDYGKECIRRTCERAMSNANFVPDEDVKYIDRIFGPYIDVRNSFRIPYVNDDRHKFDEPRRTVEEEIIYRSEGSYYAMWDFITNPRWQEKLKGREDLYDKVKSLIERAKEENYVVSVGLKEYEPTDEAVFEKVLGMMKK